MAMVLKPRCRWGKSLLTKKRKQQKIQMSRTKIKLVLVVFSCKCKGIVHNDIVPRGQVFEKTVTRKLWCVWGMLRAGRGLNCGGNPTWMLHHQSSPAHPAPLIRSYLPKQASFIPHPPCSRDLSSTDFFLFPELKTTLKEYRFQITDEIQEHVIRELRAITESAFQEAFQH